MFFVNLKEGRGKKDSKKRIGLWDRAAAGAKKKNTMGMEKEGNFRKGLEPKRRKWVHLKRWNMEANQERAMTPCMHEVEGSFSRAKSVVGSDKPGEGGVRCDRGRATRIGRQGTGRIKVKCWDTEKAVKVMVGTMSQRLKNRSLRGFLGLEKEGNGKGDSHGISEKTLRKARKETLPAWKGGNRVLSRKSTLC